jgi:hypothetical protein
MELLFEQSCSWVASPNLWDNLDEDKPIAAGGLWFVRGAAVSGNRKEDTNFLGLAQFKTILDPQLGERLEER